MLRKALFFFFFFKLDGTRCCNIFLWQWSQERSEVEWSRRCSKTAEQAKGEVRTEVDMIVRLENDSKMGGRYTLNSVSPMAGHLPVQKGIINMCSSIQYE